jgi:hypothetical protein
MNYELLFAERLLPERDSANSPLERGLGVCYGAILEHRFGFGVQYKAGALLLFPFARRWAAGLRRS